VLEINTLESNNYPDKPTRMSENVMSMHIKL